MKDSWMLWASYTTFSDLAANPLDNFVGERTIFNGNLLKNQRTGRSENDIHRYVKGCVGI